jgi:hypothetical protein
MRILTVTTAKRILNQTETTKDEWHANRYYRNRFTRKSRHY